MRRLRRQEGRHAAGSVPASGDASSTDEPKERTERITTLSDLADACQLAGMRVAWGPLSGGATRHVRVWVVGATPVGVRADFVGGAWFYVWHTGADEGRSIATADDVTVTVDVIRYVLHRRVM
ncbi:hypothetical protein [Actinomadura rupiterrae]|uniref:hypothetical protein n=1 Tax=Actinomadura rupiterrae TaxID=559627 RepID=UPI0020A6035C|nr:hypothetical protein [Actinomadura rupiterrae]MCP2342735.1 hypothetical protein [Actinomadura rupiterrae]